MDMGSKWMCVRVVPVFHCCCCSSFRFAGLSPSASARRKPQGKSTKPRGRSISVTSSMISSVNLAKCLVSEMQFRSAGMRRSCAAALGGNIYSTRRTPSIGRGSPC